MTSGLPAPVAKAIHPSNALERAIAVVSPRWAQKRALARVQLAASTLMAGGYQGARTDRAGLKGWTPFPGSAEADLNPDLSGLRSRSRDLVRNSPLASGAISSTVTSVIGRGLRPHPRIDRQILGLSDEQADAWERRARELFTLWADSTNCDIENELTFGQLQALAFRSTLESGDVLRLMRFRERPGEMFGTRIQLVEGDRICNPDYRPDELGMAGGVESDEDGRPVRYWVTDQHPGNTFGLRPSKWKGVPVWGAGTNRRMACLMFWKTRPGQRRGAPFLAPVIEQLKQLERYSHAELMAAVVSGMFTVFLKSEGGASLGPTIATDVAPEDEDRELNLGYGAMLELREGEDIESANPGRPNAAFDPFVLSVLRQIGVGLEIPFEILVAHFQSSYSAARAAILRAYQFYLARRQWNVDCFGQPAYEALLWEAVARGLLEAPGFFDDPLIRHAYCRAAWTGDAMPQIDPLKEINAAKTRIDLGVSTIQQETTQITGGDWEANHRQRVKETRMRRADGLDVEAFSESVVTESREPDQLGPGEGNPDEDDEVEAREE